MKKIFIIIGSLDIGGTEKQLLKKIEYLKKNFDFTVIIFFRKGELFNSFEKLGIRIIDLSNKKRGALHYLNVFFKIFFIFRKFRPEIINLYLPHSYFIAGFLSYFFPKQVFIMSRRSLNNYQKKIPFVRFFEKNFLHKKMTYILANSNAIKDELVHEEGVEKEKIKIIYNSVELNNFKKFKKKNEIRILHIANFIPYKNHRLLINACGEISSIKNFKVDLIGDGELSYKNELKEVIKKNDLTSKFFFRGKVKDFKDIVKYSDIGVLTSDEEGFSNAILEYMSLSLPVIATKVGGNTEIIDHYQNGFLVEKNDYKGLAKYLEILISDKELCRKLGENGYNKVKENFNIRGNMKKYKDLYDSL